MAISDNFVVYAILQLPGYVVDDVLKHVAVSFSAGVSAGSLDLKPLHDLLQTFLEQQ
jgi:hypothetical protein